MLGVFVEGIFWKEVGNIDTRSNEGEMLNEYNERDRVYEWAKGRAKDTAENERINKALEEWTSTL